MTHHIAGRDGHGELPPIEGDPNTSLWTCPLKDDGDRRDVFQLSFLSFRVSVAVARRVMTGAT
jgi:hypothetical protein